MEEATTGIWMIEEMLTIWFDAFMVTLSGRRQKKDVTLKNRRLF